MQDLPTTSLKSAGFWKRFNAYGVDATIVLIFTWLIGWLVGLDAHAQQLGADDIRALNQAIAALQGGQVDPSLQTNAQDALLRSLLGGSLIPVVNDHLFMLLSAFYNISFVAGEWQATPGKRWCGIKIIMADGSPLSWTQSAYRHAMSGVSMLLGGIGYVTIFFTKEKLALHDIICKTRVVRVPKFTDTEA